MMKMNSDAGERLHTTSKLKFDLLKLSEFISFLFPEQSVVADWKRTRNPGICTRMRSLGITTTRDKSTVNGC